MSNQAYFEVKAEAMTNSFVMAINGAFFTIRSAGTTPSNAQIERAKLNVAQARYVFVDGVNELIAHLTDTALKREDRQNAIRIEQVLNHLISMSSNLTIQANRAITSGHQNKAAALLGNNAHGATGLLVQKKLMQVELTVRDLSGYRRSEPASVVKSIVSRLAHELLVEKK